ncbi:MAG: hypothetical protein IJO33_03260 [Bacilli bacterium]|nr:hypothetical protein [Bacilli bacterium]
MKNIIKVLIRSVSIYLLNFPAHFLYGYFPNNFTALFFPVNESIFQHMKMIFTCYIIFYLIIKIFKYKEENITTKCLISSLSCIIFFLIIYIPIYLNYNENLVFTLILLFLSIVFGEFITSLINIKSKTSNKLAVLAIISIFIFSAYLTFNPLDNFWFFDPMNRTYDMVCNKNY